MEKRIAVPQIGDANNLAKMTHIYMAMKQIKEIDKSDFFRNYFSEVVGRINEHARFEMKLSYDENQSLEEQIEIADKFLKIKFIA